MDQKGKSNTQAGYDGKPSEVLISQVKDSRSIHFKSKKVLTLTAVLGVGLIVLATILIRLNNQPKPALQFTYDKAVIKVSQEEYRAILADAQKQGLKPDDAKKQIIESYRYKLVAHELRVDPTQEEIARAINSFAPSLPESGANKWQEIYGYALATTGNIEFAEKGGYHGAYFDYAADKAYESDAIDPKAIETEQKEIRSRAEHDRQMLVEGKVKTNDLINTIRGDAQFTPTRSANLSAQFRINEGGTAYINGGARTATLPEFVMNAIRALNKKAGVSPVAERRATLVGTTTESTVGYYFVSIDEVISPRPDIQKEIRKSMSIVKVRDNVSQ